MKEKKRGKPTPRRGKLVWATGISGCGRKEHLARWQEYCEKKGKKVKIYHVGQMMFEWARLNEVPLTREKVLQAPDFVLNAVRGGVLEKIKGSLEKDLYENDAVVISHHANFFWQKIYRQAYNAYYIREFNPDMFVTFIDAGEDILERLKKRKQWLGQGIDEKDVLLWQNIEVKDTKSFKQWIDSDSKFFVIPIKQPVETLHHLLFKTERKIVYVQMPISHLGVDDLEKVKLFVRYLWNYFVVFDPLTIETGVIHAEEEGVVEDLTKHFQAVHRDLNWFIPQVDATIAYIIKPVFTAGVIDECVEAYNSCKSVWVIFPEETSSPFLKFRARIFKSTEEFFDFAKTQ
ncbi:MAG: AAA family ATPase [Candidatus Marinimicrobia bacterium]|nr:AAA family ATPase [Candidatus Neomarinimicrobiota bacterium]